MTADASIQKLYDKRNSIRSAALSLLTDTIWPSESKKAADALKQTINDLPDFPPDASVTPLTDILMEFIHVLEGAHRRIEDASEEYGKGKRGPFGAVRAKLSSGHRRRCTDALWGCWAEIERASGELRSCLSKISTSGETLTGPVQDTPSEAQPPTTPLVEANRPSEPSAPPQTLSMKAAGQTVASEHPTSQPATLQDSSSGPVEDGEKRASIRERVLIVARKTFKSVEAGSGAIPVVGDFVGVAAKVGLAFVDMIETMDSNEDVSKELTSHTEELSSQLEHFKKNVNAETEDQVAGRIDKLQRELERVQAKVNKWNSSGLFKKLLLASDHAEEFKASQDTVQTALERMELLVSLKTNDIVVELKDTVLRVERTRLLDRLGDGSYGARGNAIDEVVCLPGTRVEILSRIDEWIRDTPTPENRVLWIRGMAGRGKSTIASTVAYNWGSKGSCAIFHFRRGQHVQEDRFICALARQLGKSLVPEVKKAILECVRENEDIAKERLEEQFKTLFIGSLGNVRNQTHPIVIVVDALDECKNVNDAVRFVRFINQHSTSLPANVKFLLTCRPEPPLVLALELGKWRAEDLDSTSHVDGDIRRVIQHACARIREEHDLPQRWPSSTNLEAMVKMAQGLFQWARTAIAYISNRSPEDRLQELLQHPSEWGGLDELYHQILSRAFEEVGKDRKRKQMLSWVLGTIVVAPYPVTLEILAFLHSDHRMFEGQEFVRFLRNDILADLNSLLHIPKSAFEPMRLMHTSIRDLLTDRERCEDQSYSVDPLQDHRRLGTVSLEIMQRDLKQNICNLPNSGIQDALNIHVPSGLRYCCRAWSTHLVAGVSSPEATGDAANTVLNRFQLFSNEKILSWLEVMSLIGAVSEAYAIAKQVHQWLLKWPADISDDSLTTLWNDTQRLITGFFEPILSNALGVYASALPRCPVETKLWLKYHGQAMSWFLVGKRERNWSANIWTASAASEVNSVAFSPDGRSVASGSGSDKEGGVVQLWDEQTGARLSDALAGHSDLIGSVVFSPDGKVLASGSRDKTVRLWDVQTGAPLGNPLTGHSSWIMSLVFSPDGKVLASGSRDNAVRLWDTQTGAPRGTPLTGHKKGITSVVFSPDGKVLASGSRDKKVRLWDVQSGARLGDALTGHSDVVTSVVFSPDGKVLASGSGDNTIRLWGVGTRALSGGPLTGHSACITSVVFSLDGKVLASGSQDMTVRLWDAQTGAPLGDPLTGHSDSVTSVVFSSDSTVLASGSGDNTIRLWDAQTGALLVEPLTGHSSGIRSVVFSPNSKVLASGSGDKTVRLWDAQLGASSGDPPTVHSKGMTSVVFSVDSGAPASEDKTVELWDMQNGVLEGDHMTGHTMSVTSVVFSPDSKVLASGSDDKTIRLWDAQTGALCGDPLTGHNMGVTSLVFSPNSKVLASGSSDETVRLWDVQTGAPLGDPLTGHSDWIRSIMFSPDGKVLASGSDDKTVRLWETQTGAPLGNPLTGHSNWVRSVVFSSDGKLLASGSSDNTVQMWDARTGDPLGDRLTGHQLPVISVVFSPDGKALASGSWDNTVRLWDTRTGAPIGEPLTDHSDWITSVVFSPDGKVLASGSHDKTVRLWDAQTGASLGDPLTGHSDLITSVVFSPNGKVLMSVSRDGMIRFWDPLALKSFLAYRPFDLLAC